MNTYDSRKFPPLPTTPEAPNQHYRAFNTGDDFEQPRDIREYLALVAREGTVLGQRSAANENIANAPMVLRRFQNAFVLCEATVIVLSPLGLDHDQGGLVILIGRLSGCDRSTTEPKTHSNSVLVSGQGMIQAKRWARMALEQVSGEPLVTTAVSTNGKDTSFSSLRPYEHEDPDSPFTHQSEPAVRIKLERVDSDLHMWYQTHETNWQYPGARQPTPQEISLSWQRCKIVVDFFGCPEAEQDIWVGCYASRPSSDFDARVHEELMIEFEGLETPGV